ncbi:MAG TPA: hypothetical protein VGD17_19120 [Chitinophagaceae bacterium]
MFITRTIFTTLARKSAICFVLTATAILTFASKGGGGGDKNKNVPITSQFTPIRTASGFTLKAGPTYRGSHLFNQEKKKDAVLFNSVITYQRGNTTFILPYKSRVTLNMNKTCSKSNLNVVDLKFNLRK